MKKYEGKWSQGYEFNEMNLIEGTVEFKNNEIIVDFGDKNIFANTTLTTKIEEEYILVYCDRFLTYGKGKARRAIISPNSEDIINLSNVDNEIISEVKFNISNLYWWLGDSGLSEEDGKFIVRNDIEIMGKSIFIETFPYRDEELGTIETIPMINIKYDKPVSLKIVEQDISSISKFFAILIGRIDSIQDIVLRLGSNDYLIGYFTAANNTHMTEYNYYSTFRRTSYKHLNKSLSEYYLYWCEFYKKYYIVLEHYFNLHISIPLTIEDMFTSWCNIYDGYSIHKNETDLKAEELEKCIVNYLKENDSLENGFKEILNSLGSKYDRKQIGRWFKNGYTLRKSFGVRLKEIFDDNFDILLKNIEEFKFKSNAEAIKIYIYINNTRNYYTHLKELKKEILTINQMVQFNRIAKCTFISILLTGIGFEKYEIFELLKRDDAGIFFKIE